MVLTYWYAKNLDGNPAADVREATRHCAITERKALLDDGQDMTEVVKVTLEFTSKFDLLKSCSGDECPRKWAEEEALRDASTTKEQR